MRDKVFWSAVQKIWGIKSNKILIRVMGKIAGKDFWNLSTKELQRNFPEIPQEMVACLFAEKNRVNIEKEFHKLSKQKVKIIGIYDKDYPKNLKNIYDSPPLLYVKGHLVECNLKIALVGSRKASPYGKKTALKLAQDLSNNGIQIISGLARGIDACGHQGALVGRGGTVAVLGSGVDVIYPRENIKLYQEIINFENSCVLSEFPLGTEPQKFYFPLRNRIISGLADGILVIEAGEKSGSLITAELGLEQGKDVFAVPGPIDNLLYKGSHKLIKDGAKLIDCVEDILEEYGQLTLFKDITKNTEQLSPMEKEILAFLSSEPVSLDNIINNTKLSTQEILTTLSLLEIKGYIKEVRGRKYISLIWGD
ncbi:MAG: DNA-processing protein DprA [Peptococcales bacterium]|jgi:DNA processing protein